MIAITHRRDRDFKICRGGGAVRQGGGGPATAASTSKCPRVVRVTHKRCRLLVYKSPKLRMNLSRSHHKGAPMLTVPRFTSKSSTKDLTRPTLVITVLSSRRVLIAGGRIIRFGSKGLFVPVDAGHGECRRYQQGF